MKIDSATDALLVVDVQNDFCLGGALAVAGGDEVVEVVNRVSGRFVLAAATQDWHPSGHVSFASSHPGKKPYDSVDTPAGVQALWPDHCLQGTKGAGFHPGLDTRPFGIIVRKGRNARIDSYSAFRENDRTTRTGLGEYFSGLGVKRIFVCGLATDFCVKWSALDARTLGFAVIGIRDAMRGVDIPLGSVLAAVREMEAAGVAFVDSRELDAQGRTR
jgi:nicotinamidase/pyrazinamidase